MANYWILIYTDSLEQIFYILDEFLLSEWCTGDDDDE